MQIAVCFLVQLIQTVSLSHQLFPLHLQHLGIIACHQGRHQHSFLLVGLAFENINGQFYDLIAVCRIDVGCIKQRVAHQLDAAILTRKAVDAAVQSPTPSPSRGGEAFPRSHRRAVVGTKHKVYAYIFIISKPLLGCFVGCLLRPVTLE